MYAVRAAAAPVRSGRVTEILIPSGDPEAPHQRQPAIGGPDVRTIGGRSMSTTTDEGKLLDEFTEGNIRILNIMWA